MNVNGIKIYCLMAIVFFLLWVAFFKRQLRYHGYKFEHKKMRQFLNENGILPGVILRKQFEKMGIIRNVDKSYKTQL